MSRVQAVAKEKANGELKQMYEGIEKKLGKVPNIFQNMGNSPAVLKGYLDLSDAAEQSSLDPKLREKISLIVGQTNRCNYCLSAHTLIAKNTGVVDQDILLARKGQANDPKTQAILAFAKNLVEKRGTVSDQEVAALKKAGVSDKEIVEIILLVVVNIFTNYINLATDTKIDFPLAPALN